MKNYSLADESRMYLSLYKNLSIYETFNDNKMLFNMKQDIVRRVSAFRKKEPLLGELLFKKYIIDCDFEELKKDKNFNFSKRHLFRLEKEGLEKFNQFIDFNFVNFIQSAYGSNSSFFKKKED